MLKEVELLTKRDLPHNRLPDLVIFLLHCVSEFLCEANKLLHFLIKDELLLLKVIVHDLHLDRQEETPLQLKKEAMDLASAK